MALAAGTRIGPYEITAQIGAGGMGEVYRARDTKLDRDVALKILPEDFASEPERLARFQREARVLAALNHPNIAAIYGLEDSGETHALVLELVEGPTLAELIDRRALGSGLSALGTASDSGSRQESRAKSPKPASNRQGLPMDEALPIARQIAEALEAAHEQGIIHRDLKPANIKVTPDGVVKVLDFGLAKAIEGASGAGEARGARGEELAESPTMSMTHLRQGSGGQAAAATRAGFILGTAAYMSPEQARGKPVDKRTDIWAFGVVLFEMLTGRPAFRGEDISSTLAKVIEREPDWSLLPPDTPSALSRLLRRSLVKDARRRIPDIGVATIEIDDASNQPARPDPPDRPDGPDRPDRPVSIWQRPPVIAAMVMAAAVLASLTAWGVRRPDAAPSRVARFEISPPSRVRFSFANSDNDIAITPDGSRIVYTAGPAGRPDQLFVRAVGDLAASPLLDDLVETTFAPFTSPDGAWVGFSDEATSSIKKVSILGGPAVTVCSYEGNGIDGASWGPDDTIVFGTSASSGLWRVSSSGGEPEAITTLDAARGEVNHGWPHVLPGGRAVLFTIASAAAEVSQIALLDLDTGERHVLIPGGSYPRYSATGHIVYGMEGTLRAVGFDLDRMEVSNPNPIPVLEHVMTKTSGAANFDLAADGSLAYFATGDGGVSADMSLVWVDREGGQEAVPLPARPFRNLRLSPDGSRLAVSVSDGGSTDLWVMDLSRGTSTRLTNDFGQESYPLWTPDGERIAYAWQTGGESGLFVISADGAGVPERIPSMEGVVQPRPTAWAPDGPVVVTVGGSAGRRDIGLLSMTDGALERLIDGDALESDGAISPNGEWIAYASDESGVFEVYVQRFPELGGKVAISAGGGSQPVWSPDGDRLFYRSPGTTGEAMYGVSVEFEPQFRADLARRLFEGSYFTRFGRQFDLAPDGRRFLMIKDESGTGAQAALVLVQHWSEELKAGVPTGQ